MRAASILAAFAVLASGLALMPSAGASSCPPPDEGQPCDIQLIPTPSPDCRKVPDPPFTQVTEDCYVHVAVDPVSCPLGKTDVTYDLGRVTLTVGVCTPVDPAASSAAMQPPIYCVMAPCGPQDPVPDEPCKAAVLQQVPTVTVYVFRDCTVQVDHKAYDCVWNCGWQVLLQGPPVTVRTYGQNPPAESAAAASLPDPCGPTALCQGPECPETFVATWQFLAYMGPHASARVNRDCSREVHVDPLLEPMAAADLPDPCGPTALCQGPECPAVFVATWQFLAYMGPHASAGVDRGCHPSYHVDPILPVESAAAAAPPGIQPPPQCVTSPCCFAPCPPPCDGCEPDPVPTCQAQGVHSVTGLSVVLRSDCSVGVSYDNRLMACPHNWADRATQGDPGPVDYSVTMCQPYLDCTCPPMQASAAAADLPDLPGPPTFPVCVTEPCAYVTCDHAFDAVGPLTYEFTTACGLVLTLGAQCEASHHETVPVGPVTVRVEQCEPGNPPAPTA